MLREKISTTLKNTSINSVRFNQQKEGIIDWRNSDVYQEWRQEEEGSYILSTFYVYDHSIHSLIV